MEMQRLAARGRGRPRLRAPHAADPTPAAPRRQLRCAGAAGGGGPWACASRSASPDRSVRASSAGRGRGRSARPDGAQEPQEQCEGGAPAQREPRGAEEPQPRAEVLGATARLLRGSPGCGSAYGGSGYGARAGQGGKQTGRPGGHGGAGVPGGGAAHVARGMDSLPLSIHPSGAVRARVAHDVVRCGRRGAPPRGRKGAAGGGARQPGRGLFLQGCGRLSAAPAGVTPPPRPLCRSTDAHHPRRPPPSARLSSPKKILSQVLCR